MKPERSVKINSNTYNNISAVKIHLEKKFPFRTYTRKGIIAIALNVYIKQLIEASEINKPLESFE